LLVQPSESGQRVTTAEIVGQDRTAYLLYQLSVPILQATHKTVDQPYGTQSQETSLKIKELKRLLNKHDFLHADTVLEWAGLSGKADQNYLNEKLAQLRKIDILRS
jgi:hypothetical protein